MAKKKKTRRFADGGQIPSESGQMIDRYPKGSVSKAEAERDLPKAVQNKKDDLKINSSTDTNNSYTDLDDNRIARDSDVINSKAKTLSYKSGGRVHAGIPGRGKKK